MTSIPQPATPDDSNPRRTPPAPIGARASTYGRPADIRRVALIVREALRARNYLHSGVDDTLRCECGRRDCHATLPAAAAALRLNPERFLVVPGHGLGMTVVAADDGFLVVEPRAREAPMSRHQEVRS